MLALASACMCGVESLFLFGAPLKWSYLHQPWQPSAKHPLIRAATLSYHPISNSARQQQALQHSPEPACSTICWAQAIRLSPR